MSLSLAIMPPTRPRLNAPCATRRKLNKNTSIQPSKQLENVAFRKFRELSGRKKREFEKQLRGLKVARQKCIESMAKKQQNERKLPQKILQEH
jgi:hypothetical protein